MHVVAVAVMFLADVWSWLRSRAGGCFFEITSPCEAPCLPCLDSGSIAGRRESCRLQMADIVAGQATVMSHGYHGEKA